MRTRGREEAAFDSAVDRGRQLDRLLLWGPFAVAVALTFGNSPDDTFITLRYGYNILNGHGPVFDPGQPVNGATSPVGVVLAVVALALPGGYTYLKLKLLSLVIGALALRRGQRLVELSGLRPTLARFGLVLVGCSAPLAYASATGLETTAAVLAITGLMVELRSGRAFLEPARATALGVLAVGARPEAILVVGTLAAASFLGEKAFPLRSRVEWVAGAVAAEVGIGLFNRCYYGSWAPNTYLAKKLPFSTAWHQGTHYLAGLFAPSTHLGPAADLTVRALVLASIAVLAIGVWTTIGCRAFRSYEVIAAATQMAFVVNAGGDWMRGFRFMAPAALCLPVLYLIGLQQLGEFRYSSARLQRVTAAAALAAVTCQSSLLLPIGHAPVSVANLVSGVSDRNLVARGGYGGDSLDWAISGSVLSCLPRGTLVASTEIGYSGYANPQLRMLDLRGLTDRRVASAPDRLKWTWGVWDLHWYRRHSFLGPIIMSANPAVILTFDPAPPRVLGGSYELAAQWGSDPVLYEYSRTGRACPASGTANAMAAPVAIPRT